jgi:hypothetical protein
MTASKVRDRPTFLRPAHFSLAGKATVMCQVHVEREMTLSCVFQLIACIGIVAVRSYDLDHYHLDPSPDFAKHQIRTHYQMPISWNQQT